MSSDSFYFGRLKFGERQTGLNEYKDDYSGEEKTDREYLVEYIKSSEAVYIEDDAEWHFGSSKTSEDYILGKFGKVFPDEPTEYDDKLGDFVQQQGKDADVSYFVLFFDPMIITFSRKLRIGPDQFREAFAEGFNARKNEAGLLDIEIIEWEEPLEEILYSADRVFSLDFDLETTNPGPTDEMKEMDNEFREANAEDFEINLDTESALNLSANVIRSAVGFVKNSYGNATAKFERDGREEEYSTKDPKASKSLDEPENLDELAAVKGSLEDQAMALEEEDDD